MKVPPFYVSSTCIQGYIFRKCTPPGKWFKAPAFIPNLWRTKLKFLPIVPYFWGKDILKRVVDLFQISFPYSSLIVEGVRNDVSLLAYLTIPPWTPWQNININLSWWSPPPSKGYSDNLLLENYTTNVYIYIHNYTTIVELGIYWGKFDGKIMVISSVIYTFTLRIVQLKAITQAFLQHFLHSRIQNFVS